MASGLHGLVWLHSQPMSRLTIATWLDHDYVKAKQLLHGYNKTTSRLTIATWLDQDYVKANNCYMARPRLRQG